MNKLPFTNEDIAAYRAMLDRMENYHKSSTQGDWQGDGEGIFVPSSNYCEFDDYEAYIANNMLDDDATFIMTAHTCIPMMIEASRALMEKLEKTQKALLDIASRYANDALHPDEFGEVRDDAMDYVEAARHALRDAGMDDEANAILSEQTEE